MAEPPHLCEHDGTDSIIFVKRSAEWVCTECGSCKYVMTLVGFRIYNPGRTPKDRFYSADAYLNKLLLNLSRPLRTYKFVELLIGKELFNSDKLQWHTVYKKLCESGNGSMYYRVAATITKRMRGYAWICSGNTKHRVVQFCHFTTGQNRPNLLYSLYKAAESLGEEDYEFVPCKLRKYSLRKLDSQWKEFCKALHIDFIPSKQRN